MFSSAAKRRRAVSPGHQPGVGCEKCPSRGAAFFGRSPHIPDFGICGASITPSACATHLPPTKLQPAGRNKRSPARRPRQRPKCRVNREIRWESRRDGARASRRGVKQTIPTQALEARQSLAQHAASGGVLGRVGELTGVPEARQRFVTDSSARAGQAFTLSRSAECFDLAPPSYLGKNSD